VAQLEKSAKTRKLTVVFQPDPEPAIKLWLNSGEGVEWMKANNIINVWLG
jgi:hypothetical protein